MEELYSKLYNKYTKLKKEKESKLEQLNRDQEVKFLNYAAAADEMIKFLKSENDQLHSQVEELKYEVAVIRSSKDDQEIQYQKLFIEENQKNKELSEEVAKLKKLERDGTCDSGHKKFESRQPNTHTDSPVERGPSNLSATKSKKRKSVPATEVARTPLIDVEHNYAADECCDWNEVDDCPLSTLQVPCCQRKIDTSGYSFSLTWINNSGGEAELVYCVLSLGTFERVAPEWMKETLMFSTSMCSVFFERVSRVIKGR